MANKDILIPSPEVTFREIIRIIGSTDFLDSVINTSKKSVTGFLIALGIGIMLGIIGGFFKVCNYLLRPLLLINTAVTNMAIILLSLIWLESEKATKLQIASQQNP